MVDSMAKGAERCYVWYRRHKCLSYGTWLGVLAFVLEWSDLLLDLSLALFQLKCKQKLKIKTINVQIIFQN